MCISARMFPMWWVDSYTCQKSLFPCNLTPAELQDRIFSPSCTAWASCSARLTNIQRSLKKVCMASWLESSTLHIWGTRKYHRWNDPSVLNAYAWLSHSSLYSMPLLKPCDGVNLWRSCYKVLGGHVAEISLLKSQVSFCLHIFPNTSWSLSPSGFQWTLIKMNLASCAFDLIPPPFFFFSWASRIKVWHAKKKSPKKSNVFILMILPQNNIMC